MICREGCAAGASCPRPHGRPAAGNDGLHDIRGAITDLQPEHIPQPLLEREIAGIAGMAMHQQAAMDGLIGQQGRPPFAHGGFGRMGQALVFQPQRIHREQPRRLDLGVESRELVRNALE